jgi:hypothetical protein
MLGGGFTVSMDPFDIAERFELSPREIDEDLYGAERVVTCVECDRPLEHEEMVLGAWCNECRPEYGGRGA